MAFGTIGKVLGVGVIGLAAVAGGGVLWVSNTAAALVRQPVDAHRVELPVPFPLTEAEKEELRAERLAAAGTGDGEVVLASADPLDGVDLDAVALQRAIERGRHLVSSRYVCVECHGTDFGGSIMVDDPMLGRWAGPNLTKGEGSVTREYTTADWDRAVRHGIRRDGTASLMPAEDFWQMSDRELSDILAYIGSMPPVDRPSDPITLGPLGKVLVATGQIVPAAIRVVTDHHTAHAVDPPPVAPDATFGRHLAQVCTGCHQADLAGGPITGGDPSWAPAANLTPAGPIGAWSYEDFVTAMRTGTKPDGSTFAAPMTLIPKYAANMTDTELQALWAFLRTLPPTTRP